MADDFRFDVFPSHNSKEKAVVRQLGAQLKKDCMRAWLGKEHIKPSDSIPSKIEEVLEHSRALVLCMSPNGFGADRPQLESYMFRLRNPLNKDRCFITARLDDVPITGSLTQLLYISRLPQPAQR